MHKKFSSSHDNVLLHFSMGYIFLDSGYCAIDGILPMESIFLLNLCN